MTFNRAMAEMDMTTFTSEADGQEHTDMPSNNILETIRTVNLVAWCSPMSPVAWTSFRLEIHLAIVA